MMAEYSLRAMPRQQRWCVPSLIDYTETAKRFPRLSSLVCVCVWASVSVCVSAVCVWQVSAAPVPAFAQHTFSYVLKHT